LSASGTVLEEVRPLIEPAKIELGPAHIEYVFTFADAAAWAISLELAAFLLAFCRVTRPNVVADLGSGFSSFVFRTYQREQPGTRVVSVDDSQEWLGRTGEFLRAGGLSTDELIVLDDFTARFKGAFDLVLHDLGTMPVRGRSLGLAIDAARSDGIVVLDDVHMSGYREFVDRFAEEKQRTVLDLAPLTQDAFGRYACALVPASATSGRSA
jgi:predicted O-methyltransferase YrrM